MDGLELPEVVINTPGSGEEEATLSADHVAFLATVQVATQQPMSASDEEAAQAPLALVAMVQVVTPTLQAGHYLLMVVLAVVILLSLMAMAWVVLKYGGEYISTLQSHSAMPLSVACGSPSQQ